MRDAQPHDLFEASGERKVTDQGPIPAIPVLEQDAVVPKYPGQLISPRPETFREFVVAGEAKARCHVGFHGGSIGQSELVAAWAPKAIPVAILRPCDRELRSLEGRQNFRVNALIEVRVVRNALEDDLVGTGVLVAA